MHLINSKINGFCILFLAILFVACSPKEPITSVSANGEEINFINEGSGDLALVFVHGFGNNNSIWSDQVAHFSKEFQVIALDLPGFGVSTHNRTEWSMQAFGADVNAVVDALGLKNVILIGFSMGSPVVLEAAQLAGEELKGLILVDQIRDTKVHYSEEMIQGIQGFLNDLMAAPTQEKLVAGGFYTQNVEKSTQRVMDMMASMEPNEGWNASFLDIFKWENERDELALTNAGVPIALINADNQPTNSDNLRELVPGIQIDIMENTGHCVMWDFPEKFNALVEANIQRFLNSK